MENWKPIKGYKGIYEVSDLGRIKSVNRDRVTFGTKHKQGYLTISLRKNRKNKSFLVHRLVAIAFLINHKRKSEVNHKDGNKRNNTVINLEWSTRKENEAHALKNDLKPKGERQGLSKLKEKDILPIRKMIADGINKKEIAAKFNVSGTAIGHIGSRRSWGHVV